MKILFIKLRKSIWEILFLTFTLCLIIFSKSNIISVKKSLNIWFNNVIPSLFPFFIATELLNQTEIPGSIGKLLNKFMRPIFNVPGIGAYALFMGILSGYPVGAKIVANLKENSLCTEAEAERLITFTNNSGPLFILGTVGISLFYDSSIGFLLLFTHILASLTVGIIFRFWKSQKRNSIETVSLNNNIQFNSLGEILSNSIFSAIKSIVMIGGFIVFFGIIISIMQQSKLLSILQILFSPLFNIIGIKINFLNPIITGLIELTSGVSLVSTIPCKNLGINVILCAFLLGFGGISVMLQVLSIISKANISIKPYIIGKLLQGCFAAFYTFIIINSFSYFGYLNI